MDNSDRDHSEGPEESTGEIEMMEVESGSLRGQTILLSACSTLTNPSTIATQLSLALQQILRFHSQQQNTPYTKP